MKLKFSMQVECIVSEDNLESWMCMLKKGLSLIVMGLLCTVLSTAAFASIQLNPVDDVTIEINEPKIGSERQVFVKGSMVIAIRAYGDKDIDMSLYKVIPSINEDELDDIAESDMILRAQDIPFEVASGGSIVTLDVDADTVSDVEEAVESEAPELSGSDSNEKSDSIINGTEALLQKDRISSKDRQEIINTYNDVKDDIEDQIEDLEDAYEAFEDRFEEGLGTLEEMNEDDQEVIADYLTEVAKTEALMADFQNAQNAYKAIFEIPIFGPENLMDTEIPTFFQKTVEKISPGLYKMVFSDVETDEIYDTIKFEVSKELTEEDIKDLMPTNKEDLILPGNTLKDESNQNTTVTVPEKTKTEEPEASEPEIKSEESNE